MCDRIFGSEKKKEEDDAIRSSIDMGWSREFNLKRYETQLQVCEVPGKFDDSDVQLVCTPKTLL